ncbi:MAG: HAMP domain-containing histidine kinase [Bifidobacteriaceae bacterium]|jgi:signal transduction histidine kinase|nr:HAMP domain-containing histidine kinase [Bifidobacteriaceae bacterium]
MLAIKNWWSKQLLQTRITLVLVSGLTIGLIICSIIGYSIISNIIYSNLQWQISRIDPSHLGFPELRPDTLTMANPFIATVAKELMSSLVKYLIFTTIFIVTLGGIVTYFVSRYELTQITQTNQKQENFVSDVTHELKTPLTVIKGQAEIYKMKRTGTTAKTLDIKDIDKHMTNIEISACQMQELVEELLALSRLDSQKTAPNQKINIIESLQSALKSLPDFNHSIKIFINKTNIANKSVSQNTEQTAVYIKADSDQIKRLLINLLSNIEKYTPAKSPVEIIILQSQKTITLKIIDHGKGVNTNELSQLYDRFYTTEKSRNSELSGSGLGLSIVQEIIKKTGGIIKAEHTNGGGLTHKMIFPRF